jgi:hypothetical protein
VTERRLSDPSELRRGLRLGWAWGESAAGQRMSRDGVPPRGRLVTVADLPNLGGTDLGLQVDGHPRIVLDPRLALERGKTLTLLEDAPIPQVLNQHRDGRPAGAVYIGRPSPWGNPFAIGRDGDRDAVMEKYITWLGQTPEIVDRARRELAGKDLVCWCAPAACHGHVLRDLALGRPLTPPDRPEPVAMEPGLPGLDL